MDISTEANNAGNDPQGAEGIGMYTVKQVIVMRTDLNMRKGKMVAQGAHASMAFLLESHSNQEDFQKWKEQHTPKICVSVPSEEALVQVYDQAKALGLTVHLVTDLGYTEFAGVPTKTCLAIGPNDADLIDVVTGSLKLL